MKFLAIEHRLPAEVVTNDDVVDRVRRASATHLSAAEMETLEHLIRSCFASTGTRVRYHRAGDESAVELAADAGARALASAGLDPLDIDLLLYVGVGRGVLEPASASIYQDVLGLRRATAFDVLDACGSWVRALQLARLYLESGTYRTVMIMNAEFVGREGCRYELTSLDEFAHWHPSATLGEAATATILVASEEPDEFTASFRTWGHKRDLCFVPMANIAGYFGKPAVTVGGFEPMQFVSFGLSLLEFGTRKLVEHYRTCPQFAEFDPDIVFGHSASDGASGYVVDACAIDRDRFRFDHRRYANTISATIPLSMSDAMKSGALTDGDRVLLLAVSAGVTTALTRFVFRTGRSRPRSCGVRTAVDREERNEPE